MKSIYIAGPLFNTADRSYLEHIAEVLEKAGDIRWLNNFIWGLCNDGRNIVKHPEDLLEKLT